MDLAFPYARYACPCTRTTSTPPSSVATKGSVQDTASEVDDDDTFDPHHPRAHFSLYPIEHLLYCDDCHQIRCPRCTTEEMMYWLCPSCLFEVASSGVKSDGNRCTRHCYECPLCSANLSVTAINLNSDSSHDSKPESSSPAESYILLCHYCDWSSLDIGISLNKPTKITEQLNKLWKQRHHMEAEKDGLGEHGQEQGKLHHDAAFANLHKFYKEQLNESGDQSNPYSNSPYSSPANLARIMSLYGGLSINSLKKAREKPQPMREAMEAPEGLQTFTANNLEGDEQILARIEGLGLDDMSTQQQRLMAPSNYDAKVITDLWPVATRLTVRRGKRCRACRQFLARPDQKLDRLKYKIRLLASNYIQRLSVRPLNVAQPMQNAAFRLRADPLKDIRLKPHQAEQFVLTVHNPIFEPVKVTLSTPATTPGKVASRVTILCPSFTVGQNGDRWEEALSTSTTGTSNDGSRRAAMASLTGSSEGDRQPEAGKVWNRHWNTTSVIVEVVPGAVANRPSIVSAADTSADIVPHEDDDILEVPIYVRVEWEGALHPHDHAHASIAKADPDRKEHRELAYWCVLGLGRIT